MKQLFFTIVGKYFYFDRLIIAALEYMYVFLKVVLRWAVEATTNHK